MTLLITQPLAIKSYIELTSPLEQWYQRVAKQMELDCSRFVNLDIFSRPEEGISISSLRERNKAVNETNY